MVSKKADENIADEFHRLDIGRGSLLHYLFTRPPIQEETLLKTYLMPWAVTAILFYGLPLIIAYMTTRDKLFANPLSGRVCENLAAVGYRREKPPLLDQWEELHGLKGPCEECLRLPGKRMSSRKIACRKTVTDTSGLNIGILDDWNVTFACLVTLPVLVIFTLSGRSVVPKRVASLAGGLQDLKRKRAPSQKQVHTFVESWNKRFKTINLVGQLAGILVGIAVAFANYKTAFAAEAQNWAITEGSLNVAGWVGICWQLPIPYWLLSVYLVQGIALIFLLYSLTQKFNIKISPFHHDNCCGLKSIGHIGLRNQYLLAVLGMNLLVLFVINRMRGESCPVYLPVAAALAYIMLGPMIFIGPLLPFRKSMLSAKEHEQEKVATRLQQEYARIMKDLGNGLLSKKDEDSIDRLQKLRVIVNRIPVWPFDTTTLRKFLTAYISPFMAGIISLGIQRLLSTIG